jgi:hypothetical protein
VDRHQPHALGPIAAAVRLARQADLLEVIREALVGVGLGELVERADELLEVLDPLVGLLGLSVRSIAT